jgi:mannose/fructose/N-acetylgalactosamine-specific phosphotransferase system component IIC
MEEILLLALLGGVLAVDERVGWQSLFSQPVMSSAVVGVVFGEFTTAVTVGVVIELVWLSILPMRGSRRPDAIAGALVGAGVACFLVRHTGEPRILFAVALGVLVGLIVGEIVGGIGRRLHRIREQALGRMEVPSEAVALRRRLLAYFLYSVGFTFAAEALLIVVMLPLAALVVEWMSDVVGPSFVAGAEWWENLVPTLGAGALIQMYWHRQHNRYLITCAVIVLLLLWFK